MLGSFCVPLLISKLVMLDPLVGSGVGFEDHVDDYRTGPLDLEMGL